MAALAADSADDAGRYFRYMADFIDFAAADAEAIQRTRPILEEVLPEIVADFCTHLLRYPPTRRFFLKRDGTADREYVELRMRHQTNFWLRTAEGVFDDYARCGLRRPRPHPPRGRPQHLNRRAVLDRHGRLCAARHQ